MTLNLRIGDLDFTWTGFVKKQCSTRSWARALLWIWTWMLGGVIWVCGHMMTWWGYPGTGAGDQEVTRDVIIIDRTQDLDLTPGESYVNTNKENILCPTQFWGTQICSLQWQVHVHVRAMRNLFKGSLLCILLWTWCELVWTEFGNHLTTYRKWFLINECDIVGGWWCLDEAWVITDKCVPEKWD